VHTPAVVAVERAVGEPTLAAVATHPAQPRRTMSRWAMKMQAGLGGYIACCGGPTLTQTPSRFGGLPSPRPQQVSQFQPGVGPSARTGRVRHKCNIHGYSGVLSSGTRTCASRSSATQSPARMRRCARRNHHQSPVRGTRRTHLCAWVCEASTACGARVLSAGAPRRGRLRGHPSVCARVWGCGEVT
jgi:hypothetical protein